MSATVITLANRRPAQSRPPALDDPDRVPIKIAKVLAARRKSSKGERRMRRQGWSTISSEVQYFEALRELGHAARYAARWNVRGANQYAGLDDGSELLAAVRDARARWFLTPVSTVAELNKKRRERAKGFFAYTPVDPAAVDRLIAADEQWLLANMRNRRKQTNEEDTAELRAH